MILYQRKTQVNTLPDLVFSLDLSYNKKMILEVRNLVKKFDSFTAIDDISFEVEEGQILGFLGPNGAGKSTTIYCLLGLIVPDQGSIRIFGKDVFKKRSEIMKCTNYASAEYNLPWNLSIWENLLVYAKLYEVPEAKKRIAEVLDVFEMTSFQNKAIRELSTGLRARANLCKSFT